MLFDLKKHKKEKNYNLIINLEINNIHIKNTNKNRKSNINLVFNINFMLLYLYCS